MLLIQTLTVCILINSNHERSWFSFILFLVFLGGILILFIYVTSVASNEKFKISLSLFLLFILTVVIIYLTNIFYNDLFTYLINLIHTLDLSIWSIKNQNEASKSIFKLFNYPSNLITILLIYYLLFSLIVIVKITNFNKGPLRSIY